MFGGADSDKTMLRPSGPQGGMGAVPQGNMGIVRVEEGKDPGRVYEVKKETLSIGRSRESDIFLEDLAVSRLHASIVNQGNGNYALRDEGSANGTKVNGQLVNKYQVYPLNEGDKIQLGQTVLVFAKR
jgi:pSer/pThr/pTyr-binding forkhead associated (FHA) protein